MAERIQPTFAIGIPARDEEQLVGRSIESVLAAADRLPRPWAVRLVVACDACVDGTPDIVRAAASRDRRVGVVEGSWNSAGACREAAIRCALDSVGTGVPLADVWIATTDADTVVPADWLSLHAAHWAQGDDAVAGVVELHEGHELIRTAFRQHYVLGHDGHGHVHGANLGVRADAYVHVGGFPPIGLAEDHALWRALGESGFTCRSSVALRVETSARLAGRAVGGFADHLRNLVDRSAAGPEVVPA